MAGRFERIQLFHWPAQEIAKYFRISASRAVQQTAQHGSYPGAVPFLDDIPRWKEYIRHSILEPTIGRNLIILETIRKPTLLRQVFAVSVGHPAEVISLQKLCGQLTDKGAMETVAHYLHVLEEAYLVAAVSKYSAKTLRQRSSPPKLVILNNAFLSAMSNRPAPTAKAEPERWGRWVENACLAHAWNSAQQVYYWRAEPHEVDMVLDGSWGRWAAEIKTGPDGARDLAGLLEFCRIHDDFSPLVLCNPGDEKAARNAGVQAVSWEEYLISGVSSLRGMGIAA